MASITTASSIGERVDALDWHDLRRQLDEHGFALTAQVLGPGECADLAELFDTDRFRSTIDMARHRFGHGRYRYFDYPLPERALRRSRPNSRRPSGGTSGPPTRR
jgi:hypothetical protein